VTWVALRDGIALLGVLALLTWIRTQIEGGDEMGESEWKRVT
jgi:hypothetical protein